MAKVCVLGFGRMGKLIVKRLLTEGHEIVAVVDAPESKDLGKDAGSLAQMESIGVNVSSSKELASVLEESMPEVVVDFSGASACVANAGVVFSRGISMVIGTTGFTGEQRERILRGASEGGVGLVISPNMSVGVNAFWKLVGKAAKLLEGYDVEIIEAHHRFKKDAPSGTALKTASVICEALGKSLEDVAVYGRHGDCPRKDGEIGVHAVRAGDIVGEHTVIFSTLGERVEVVHRAHSRDALVSGAVKAVDYVVGKKGVFGMDAVLGL